MRFTSIIMYNSVFSSNRDRSNREMTYDKQKNIKEKRIKRISSINGTFGWGPSSLSNRISLSVWRASHSSFAYGRILLMASRKFLTVSNAVETTLKILILLVAKRIDQKLENVFIPVAPSTQDTAIGQIVTRRHWKSMTAHYGLFYGIHEKKLSERLIIHQLWRLPRRCERKRGKE